MMWPVAALAVLSVIGGWIQVPGGWTAVDTFLEPVARSLQEPAGWMEVLSPLLSVGVALLGIGLAWRIWGRRAEGAEALRARVPWAARALEHKLYFDEAYNLVFYEPASRLASGLGRFLEAPLVLGSVGGIADGVRALGRRIAALQTGVLRSYAILVAAGAAVIILVFIAVR
jgi:NADH-quinone oxidoreductase subunit L